MYSLRFIKSLSPNPENTTGYEIWSNEYTKHMKYVGFITDKNLIDMIDYFESEGYKVEVNNQYVFS